ncbi:MAG: intradiol ring-cleavage dioxygenase [Betaproteobacteria bacterium]|nr:MAG: intradiol ring-cleavage dioxygenase [Betaproteobacteria bacterium]
MILSHRRRLLGAALALPFAGSAFAQLTCGSLTARQTEGPFFKTDTPQRSSFLEKGDKNVLVVRGLVLSAQCKPVKNALLDFWHADELGNYDNQGFRYRGHQFTDAQGRFRLETIVPAEYPGRARHIHVKVQAPGKRLLTTQLYFPNDPGNARDGLYRRDLEIRDFQKGEGKFDFVVEA